MKASARQQGLTLSGLIMAAALVGVAALVVMRLFPLYNEAFKVRAAMKAVASQPPAAVATSHDVYKLLLRNFEVSDVDTFDRESIRRVAKVVRVKGSNRRILRFTYEKRGPLFGNLDVVLKFDEQVELPSGGGP